MILFLCLLVIIVFTIFSIRQDISDYKKSSLRRFEECRNSITYSDSYNNSKKRLRRFLTDCIIEFKKQYRPRTNKNKKYRK